MNFFRSLVFIILLFFPAANCFAGMVTSVQNETFADNSSRMINGIAFNEDGTKLFTSYAQVANPGGEEEATFKLNEYNLSTPYDISTRTYAGNDERCELNSESDGSGNGPSTGVFDIEFSNDGMKVFVVVGAVAANMDSDKVYRFDLTSPYDISTCSYVSATTNLDHMKLQNGSNAGSRGSGDTPANKTRNRAQGIKFNETGTKLFLIFHGQNTLPDDDGGGPRLTRLLEYTLSTPYDITDLSLVTTAGIELEDEVSNPNTMTFSPNGKKIFIIDHNKSAAGNEVHQISLSNPYDTSSYTIDGRVRTEDLDSDHDQPRGIAFNKSGLKMYVGHDSTSSIYEFDLVCPFNIIEGKCPPITENKDRAGMAEAQIEMAKRTIQYSTDGALNRLKWIRRNKERQNLTNHNINFDFSNPTMASLVKKISNSEIKDNKSDEQKDIFYWSEGSISVGKVGETGISSAKKIGTNALTFGADKFTENKGIKGLALRLGKDDTDVGSAGSNLDTETFNLTYYSTSPIENDTKLLDTVLGFGRLNSDILTVLDGKSINADRRGNQLYGAIKLKDEIKKDNLTIIPSGQFDFGHTILNAYREFGAGAIHVEKQHIRTKKLRAAMAIVQNHSQEDYTFKTHGKLEYLADIDRTSNFTYHYISDDSSRNTDRLSTGSLHNLNGEVGIDFVLPNSFSLFLIYERNQAIKNGHSDRLHIALGYLPNQNLDYALKVDASDNLRSNLLVSKKLGNYKLSFDHSHDFLSEEDNYLSSINLSKDF